ncbi:hypothetical protein [Dactylosporangium sp. CA-092794]|uniref:hypothetical protein n=1 Tax=Dactylosporangium sp. CA-092794 TaxID=3239929 RepID=UPI003D8F4139
MSAASWSEGPARIGVGALLLVDADVVDETNLPRLVAAEFDDVGNPRWCPRSATPAANPAIELTVTADDHKAYYPGATPVHIRITGDRTTGRLLGAQLLGHHGAEIAKRVDTYATAISYDATVADITDLDLSYTPPLGSPWDAVQIAATAWHRTVLEPAA